jgi:hypothetical protein
MPPVPSEPEKYSIDEMMERLTNSSPGNNEDGELVIRSDGSQAIRVRKRKRRSSQPLKENHQRTRRARIVQVTAAMILIFLAAIIIGGAIIYANSKPFREDLIRKAEKSSGAAVSLAQFRINPKTANAGTLSLKWPAGNVLESLKLRGLTAEIFPASFLGNAMTGEEISIAEATLALQIPQPGEALRHSPAPGGDLPIRFNRYRTPLFNLTIGNPKTPLIRLLKSEGSLNPETTNGRPQISLYKGDIAIAGWPKLRLDRALIEFRGDEADIIGLRALHESDNRGAFELSGTVTPYQTDRTSSLDVRLESFELSGIVGPSLGKIFSGKIDSLPVPTSNFLAFRPSGEAPLTLDLAFRASPNSRIEVLEFPFLVGLAQGLDDPWFQRPVFEGDAVGRIHREGDVVTLRDLNLESKGRMAMRGEISMALNQTLSGTLQLGVAEAMIASAKITRLNAMFGPVKEGFRWITLKISGRASAPVDNFKEIYTSSAVAPRETPTPDDSEGSSFEDLTRPR